jgi:hypothetical protein
MIFYGNPPVHFMEQNNVGDAVDMPPAPCLPVAHLSAYIAACVEATGRPGMRSSRQIGLAGRRIGIPCICHVGGC